MKELDKITPLENDFGRWYTDVVKQGDLIEYGPAKGSIIFKPASFGIWENVKKEMNKIFQKENAQNLYLPLLIPLSYFEKEKQHIKGFAPELAKVTHVGEKELGEHFAIRPTSEMLFAELFAKEINSHNDLPKIYNQWANVLRWEKTTNPFLRNSEFLWQEGHTVHSNSQEARRFARKMIKHYAKFFKKYLAIPVVIGRKTSHEKFAGAVSTFTIEAMMKDGKALQSGTSHYLGQNFSKPMNIKFQNKDNKQEYGYQTSWGISTRLIGAIIMTHGDNRGIIIPPMIAPVQIDILELFGTKNLNVKEKTSEIFKTLKRTFRVRIDSSNKSPGFKAAASEIKGVPLRIEVGPRDLEKNQVTIVRRDNLDKIVVNINDVKETVKKTLKDIQDNLYKTAKDRLDQNTKTASTYDELKELINQKKFVIIPFAGTGKDEEKIKEETGATTRCMPFGSISKEPLTCFFTGKKTKKLVIFARAY